MSEKDRVTLNTLAERINMLEAQGRSNETLPLREQHRLILSKGDTEK